MLKLTPYLFFDGRCDEALEFYRKCFGGVILSKQHFKDAPQVVEGAEPDWVMHAEFEAFGMKLMMSDGVQRKRASRQQSRFIIGYRRYSNARANIRKVRTGWKSDDAPG